MSDLAKKAVACKHWRWMPGMRMLHPSMGPARVLRVTDQGVWVAKEESLASGFRVEEDGCTPDLTDPATLGYLLALVREAWGDPYMTTKYWRGPRVWTCKSDEVHSMGVCRRAPQGDTEAAALVAALEAAP